MSNTVGVAQLDAKHEEAIVNMRYYWGTSGIMGGEPDSVFNGNLASSEVTKMYKFLDMKGTVFWPSDGITVLRATSRNQVRSNVLIIGQYLFATACAVGSLLTFIQPHIADPRAKSPFLSNVMSLQSNSYLYSRF